MLVLLHAPKLNPDLLRRIYGDCFLRPILLVPSSRGLTTMTWVVTQNELDRIKNDVAIIMYGSESTKFKALWRDQRH